MDAVKQPSPHGMEIPIGNKMYKVIKLGTPICSKTVNHSRLRALGITMENLTVLAATPVNQCTPELVYVAWCTQAEEQKPLGAEALKALSTFSAGHAPTTPVAETAERKRKRESEEEEAVNVLSSGAFVLEDVLLETGRANPVINDVPFGGDKTSRLRQLTSFAEMLLCMQEQPTIERLHSWASAALS